MKPFYSVFFLAIFLFLFGNTSKASHAGGADITYVCQGNNVYKLIFTFYRDCAGIPAEATQTATLTSSCGNQTVTLLPVSSTPTVDWDTIAPGVCPGASRCSSIGSAIPGYKIYRYSANVTLLPNCVYTYSVSIGSRNGSTNLSGGSGYNLYLESTINTAFCNTSPIFTSLPIPYYCINQVYNFNQGCIDVNGDSLVFSLIQPKGSATTVVPYATHTPAYSATSPIATVSGTTFSTADGQIGFTPNLAGTFTVTMLVSEYRYDSVLQTKVLIGTAMRDIQMIMRNCNNAPPTIDIPASTNNGVVLGPNKFGVCPGSDMKVCFRTSDTDGKVKITSNLHTSLNHDDSLIVTQVNAGSDSVVDVCIKWRPSGADVGLHYFTVTIQDTICPIPGNTVLGFTFYVYEGVDAGPNKAYCPAGGPVTVNATGATSYHWKMVDGSPAVGILSYSADSGTITLAPNVSSTYVVTGNLTTGCKNMDTVLVTNVPDFVLGITTPDSVICLKNLTVLTAVATPASSGPYTYNWTAPNGTILNAQAASATVTPDASANYVVQVTSAAGCIIKDTQYVRISGVAPDVFILKNKDFVCIGDTITLSSLVSSTICGLTPGGAAGACANSTVFSNDTVGDLTISTTTISPFAGSYTKGRYQYLFTAAEFAALGMQPGTISSIAFFIPPTGKVTTGSFSGFSVKMGCTSLTQLPTTFVNNLAVVVNGQNFTTNTGFNPISLDNPYDWDGITNIIVEVCYDNSATIGGFDQVYYTATSNPRASIYRRTSTGIGCGMAGVVTANAFRPTMRFDMCLPPIMNYTYHWQPDTAIVCATCEFAKAQVVKDRVVQLTVNDGTCKHTVIDTLHINKGVVINAGLDTVVCKDTALLKIKIPNSQPITCIKDYAVEPIPFTPITPTGTPTVVAFANNNGDEGYSAPITLPFSYQHYCGVYNDLRISTNGFFKFNSAVLPVNYVYGGTPIPNVANPNNIVAFCWDDLDERAAPYGAGFVDYFTDGVAPNRTFVIRWNGVKHYSTNTFVTGQVQLQEGSNITEIHITSQNDSSAGHIMGLEDSTGTVANTPPRKNATPWKVNTPEAWRFTPKTKGQNPVSFNWTPSSTLSTPNDSNTFAMPTTTTDYVAHVAFTNGCTATDTVRVNVETAQYTIGVARDSVCGGDTTLLKVTSNNATSIAWTPMSDVSHADSFITIAYPKSATEYIMTITTAHGCKATDSVKVKVQSDVQIKLSLNSAYYCPGVNDSVLIKTIGTYSNYHWYTLQPTRISNKDSLSAAIYAHPGNQYQVKVHAGICDYYSDTFTSTIYTLQTIHATKTDSICAGDSIAVLGDAGLQNYVWHPNNEQTQSVMAKTAGIYYYTARDINGCDLKSDSAKITIVNGSGFAFVPFRNPICQGQSIVLDAGSKPNVSYNWSNGSTTNTIQVNTAGTYIVTATLSGGAKSCVSDTQIVLAVVPNPTIDLPAPIKSCDCGANFSLTTLSSSNIPTGSNYVWRNATDSIGNAATLANVTTSGMYYLQVTDPNKCIDKDSVLVDITCLKITPTASMNPVNAGTATTLSLQSLTRNGVTILGDPTVTYSWSPTATLGTPLAASTTVTPDKTTLYKISIKDPSTGCAVNDTITVYVTPAGRYEMPTAFTPNGDGKNDHFLPVTLAGTSAKIVNFRIYNQWGEMVFDYNSANSPLGWDGTFKSTNQPTAEYTYYLWIDKPNETDPSITDHHFQTGSLTLIR